MITHEENIFDLLGKGSTVYHSAILTSFIFDPYYFSNYYMPQMRSRGIKNVVVLIDSTQYDAILEDTEIFKKAVFYRQGRCRTGDDAGIHFNYSQNELFPQPRRMYQLY